MEQPIEATLTSLIKNEGLKGILVIDKIIYHSYPLFQKIPLPILLLEGGESIKQWKTVNQITEFLQKKGCQRHHTLFVVGGGTIGDVAGFSASIYKRGINWVFFPTTLLSQVDSSIGGKVAINTKAGKNQLGAFWPARHVYIFSDFLKSLPPRHYAAGMAEVIKVHSFQRTIALSHHQDLPLFIKNAIEAKLHIIGDDWYDLDFKRRIALNFGHTIGHGLEKVMPHLLHGEAVGLGMMAELYLASHLGKDCLDSSFIRFQLENATLPTDVKGLLSTISPKHFIKALYQDKKNRDEEVVFVVPGKGGIVKTFSLPPSSLKLILF